MYGTMQKGRIETREMKNERKTMQRGSNPLEMRTKNYEGCIQDGGFVKPTLNHIKEKQKSTGWE